VAGILPTVQDHLVPDSNLVIRKGRVTPSAVVTVPRAPSSITSLSTTALRTDGPHWGQTSGSTRSCQSVVAGASNSAETQRYFTGRSSPRRRGSPLAHHLAGLGGSGSCRPCHRSSAQTEGPSAPDLTASLRRERRVARRLWLSHRPCRRVSAWPGSDARPERWIRNGHDGGRQAQ